MRVLFAFVVAVGVASTAHADSCDKSLDYIFNNLADDLPQPASSYRTLLNICLETLKLTNVSDAYVLKDGGIAVVPRKDTIRETAGTLAAFCEKYPRGALRFIGKKEMRGGMTPGKAVLLSSQGPGSCPEIRRER